MEEAAALGWWGVPLGVLAGVLRVSTPFLFVSLGECLTEKSGRINLGLEGNLGHGRHGRLRRIVCQRFTLARRRRRRRHRHGAGCDACLGLLATPCQRHRRRHLADALWHRPGILPRQAADSADGTAPADDQLRLVERYAADSFCP